MIRVQLLFIMVLALFTGACTPEVGSKAWCEDMEEKSSLDWSMNEAKDYTKHCLFGKDKDKK